MSGNAQSLAEWRPVDAGAPLPAGERVARTSSEPGEGDRTSGECKAQSPLIRPLRVHLLPVGEKRNQPLSRA